MGLGSDRARWLAITVVAGLLVAAVPVAIGDVSGEAQGSTQSLVCTATPDDADSNRDAGDSKGTAVPIETHAYGCFGAQDQEDWYTFSVDDGEIVEVAFSWTADTEASIREGRYAPGGGERDAPRLRGDVAGCSLPVLWWIHIDDRSPLHVAAGPARDICLVLHVPGGFDGAYEIFIDRKPERCSFGDSDGWPEEEVAEPLSEGFTHECVDGWDILDTFEAEVSAGEEIALAVDPWYQTWPGHCVDVMLGVSLPSRDAHVLLSEDTCRIEPFVVTPSEDGILTAEVVTLGPKVNYEIGFERSPTADLAITGVEEVRDPVRTDVSDVDKPAGETRTYEVEITNEGSSTISSPLLRYMVADGDCTAAEAWRGNCEGSPWQSTVIRESLGPGESLTHAVAWSADAEEIGDHTFIARVFSWELEREGRDNSIEHPFFVGVGGLN